MTTDTPTATPPQIVFLSLPEVLKRVPVGRTAWYDAIKAGEAPKPVKLGGASMWPAHEIDALARRMMTERGR